MPGDHYFSPSPAAELKLRTITVDLAGAPRTVTTAGGVFSPERLDTGTRVLLNETPAPPQTGDLLDIGCGWGPISLELAIRSPDATVWAIDVNERALELVRRNASALGLSNVHAVTPDGVPEGVSFSAIWSNPPIRVGKAALHDLLIRWLPRLTPGAAAHLVVARNLGSDSLQRWLLETLPGGFSVDRVAYDKGYRVLRVHRP